MAFAGPGLAFVYTGMVVTDSHLFGVGHNIRRWAEAVANNYQIAVFEEAPLNKRPNTGHGPPGSLKIGLSTGVERVGPRHLVTTCTSLAPHTKWVAGGTPPWIYATPGRPMRLPLNPGFESPVRSVREAERRAKRGGTLHQRVRGQSKNYFFERAFARTAAIHPSLRPALSAAFKVQL